MHSWRILSACALCAVLSVLVRHGLGRTEAVGAARAIEGDYVIHDFHFASGETLPGAAAALHHVRQSRTATRRARSTMRC